jgi:uncharacterized protein
MENPLNISLPYVIDDDARPAPVRESLQAALAAIRSGHPTRAHRLLLEALQLESEDPFIWWLLGWTAPTSAIAASFFHHLLLLQPDDPLAYDGLQWAEEDLNRERRISLQADVLDNRLPATKPLAADEVFPPGDVKAGRLAWLSRLPKDAWIAVIYLVCITIAEGLTTLSNPQFGMLLHGLLLVAIILHATLFAQGSGQKFLLTLTMVPLIRLMSLSLPLPSFPFIYWYALVGAPLFLAAFVAFRVVGYDAAQIGLNGRKLPLQLMVGLSGVGLGYLEYLILRPDPLVEGMTLQQIWLPALILLVFTGLLEEVIFRGLIQRSALESLGRHGLLYVAALFAVLHLGYRSALDVIFVFGVALFFGWVVVRTGSILGVTLSHGLTNVALYLFIPFLLNAQTAPSDKAFPFDAITPTSPAVTAIWTADAALQVTATPATAFPSPTPTVPALPTLTHTLASPTFALTPTTANLSPTPNPTPLVLDDGDPGVFSLDGKWWSIEAGIGGDLHWAYTVPEDPTTVVEWRPDFSACGVYLVEVYLPLKFATTGAARYLVGHRGGTSEVLLDQSAYMGDWVELGSYPFDPGEGSFLRLTNATGEDPALGLLVAFDAARWTFVDHCR